MLLMTSAEHSSNTPAGAIEKMPVDVTESESGDQKSFQLENDQKMLIEGVIFN